MCLLVVTLTACQRAGNEEVAQTTGATTTTQAPTTPAPPRAPERPTVRTYTVVSGDTLWAISERLYGDGSAYQRIADASGIKNPDLIHPGQVLRIP